VVAEPELVALVAVVQALRWLELLIQVAVVGLVVLLLVALQLVVLGFVLFPIHQQLNVQQAAQSLHIHQAVRHFGFIGLQHQEHSQHDYSQTSRWR
jgi:hypothetical protein